MVHTAINIAFLDPQKVLEAAEEDTKAPVEVCVITNTSSLQHVNMIHACMYKNKYEKNQGMLLCSRRKRKHAT